MATIKELSNITREYLKENSKWTDEEIAEYISKVEEELTKPGRHNPMPDDIERL